VVGIPTLDLNSKFSISAKCGLLSSVRNFSELIGTELGHTPKREIVPDGMFYKFENIHKIWS
jgi:hypothetical protein